MDIDPYSNLEENIKIIVRKLLIIIIFNRKLFHQEHKPNT